LSVWWALKGYFGVTLQDDERQRREKVTGKVLTLDRTLEDTLPYLFTLLGVGEEAASLARMDPEVRKRRTLEAVKRLLVRETLDQPCVLIFEDLHWIDAETQAFLEVMSEAVATARLLLLVNYRPEYQHGWGSRTYYTQLRLDPLGREEAQELLTALLGEDDAPERDVLERLILEKTEGNPFFIEELVQTLAEEGVLGGERGAYRLERSPDELRIPATVQGLLASRMDRLPPEDKDLLQTLAVIGKEFPFGLLRRVAEQGEEDLYRGLSRLQAGEFIYEQPAFPEPEYTFKHALTQEVAYGSLLAARRGAVHERTARAIEELYGDALDAHYGDLAHHYARTTNTPKAVEYLHLAGEQAVQRSAYVEAIRLLSQGVERVATLPDAQESARKELSLQVALGRALTVTRGYTAPETERAYVRARELSERLDDVHERFGASMGLIQIHLLRAEHVRYRELAEELLHLAGRIRDPVHALLVQETLGVGSFWRGDPARARAQLEEVIARYDPAEHPSYEHLWGSQDPGVSALFYLGFVLVSLGYPDQALTRAREAVALARELSHPFSEALALSGLVHLHRMRGEPQAAQEVAEALTSLSSEHGFPFYLGMAAFGRAAALSERGQVSEGIEGMRAALEGARAAGDLLGLPTWLSRLGKAQLDAGQAEEGLSLIEKALEAVERTGERTSESELHCLRGQLLLVRSPPDEEEAETSFRRALEIARQHNSKREELQAATSLARLWQHQGRAEEARALLTPVYEWFTEGFDTLALREARALLE
jgi:predicted ATPase